MLIKHIFPSIISQIFQQFNSLTSKKIYFALKIPTSTMGLSAKTLRKEERSVRGFI